MRLLPAEQRFKLAAQGVPQPAPNEMKKLVNENESQPARLAQQPRFQHDLALQQETCGLNRCAWPGAPQELAAMRG